jgi:hypothetical protein
MIDIADKIYAATGLTLGAEAAAAIEKMIQAENEKLLAALIEINDLNAKRIGYSKKIERVIWEALGEKE